jgi:hypothetical protein
LGPTWQDILIIPSHLSLSNPPHHAGREQACSTNARRRPRAFPSPTPTPAAARTCSSPAACGATFMPRAGGLKDAASGAPLACPRRSDGRSRSSSSTTVNTRPAVQPSAGGPTSARPPHPRLQNVQRRSQLSFPAGSRRPRPHSSSPQGPCCRA